MLCFDYLKRVPVAKKLPLMGKLTTVNPEGISYQFENASDASDEDSSNSRSTENEIMERSTESDSTVESVDSTVNRRATGKISVGLDYRDSSSITGIEEDLDY